VFRLVQKDFSVCRFIQQIYHSFSNDIISFAFTNYEITMLLTSLRLIHEKLLLKNSKE